MSRLLPFTEAPTGGDRVHLDVLGDVRAVHYATSDNGDLAASWQMILDSRTNHRALTPGRRVTIPITTSSGWQGTLGNPRRGDSNVWEFNAAGLVALLDNYDAIAPITGNALKLDEITDAAISRGMPLTRPAALPALTAGTQGSGVGKLLDSYNTVCTAKGKRWNVNRARQITAASRPTNVAYILLANDTAGGRTVTGFATDVHVTYQDSNSWAATTVLRSATSRPYGTFEEPIDVTGKGPIPAAQANETGDNWLAHHGARLQFTQAFTVTPGQLLNAGGQPVDLATVQASDGAVRVLLTDPDTAAGELVLGAVNVPIGQTDYDVDADVLQITPLDMTPTGLAAVFA